MPSQLLSTCPASSTFKTIATQNFGRDDVACQQVIADIVGVEECEQRQLGLVDALDSDFETKLATLQERWNKIEKEGRRVVPGENVEPEFYSWFVSEKRLVRNNMIRSVRVAAQLGDPPEFYINASESTNILNLKIDRKSQTLPSFVVHVLELVFAQEKNIERAFFPRGDWCMADTLCLEDAMESWSQMKLNVLVKQVQQASCSLSALITQAASHTGCPQSTSSAATAKKRGDCPDRPASSHGGRKKLSESYHQFLESGSNIHEDTLKGIWGKAEALVNDTTLIAPVPGSSSSYHRMVASKTDQCPHLITTPVGKFNGQFKCDAKCVMFATYKICSHTVATAEVNGKLTQFMLWLIKQKCSPNLTNLSMVGIPKGAGQKGGVPKHIRKWKRAEAAG